ncbi:MAG TPA: hypothetical protein VEI96_13325 [Thermodesulfovibrionales bacterium]|nr:hypothetical protein [Thermodesulfovibrionales bacterium]
MKRSFVLSIFFIFIILSSLVLQDLRIRDFPAFGAAEAQEEWKMEFDDLCSKTQDAMAFRSDELRSLITRCDKLKPSIEKLDEASRKVYSKRLQMCRDLFSYVLESKEKK